MSIADKLQKLIDGKQYVVDRVNFKTGGNLTIDSKWKDIGDIVSRISGETPTGLPIEVSTLPQIAAEGSFYVENVNELYCNFPNDTTGMFTYPSPVKDIVKKLIEMSLETEFTNVSSEIIKLTQAHLDNLQDLAPSMVPNPPDLKLTIYELDDSIKDQFFGGLYKFLLFEPEYSDTEAWTPLQLILQGIGITASDQENYYGVVNNIGDMSDEGYYLLEQSNLYSYDSGEFKPAYIGGFKKDYKLMCAIQNQVIDYVTFVKAFTGRDVEYEFISDKSEILDNPITSEGSYYYLYVYNDDPDGYFFYYWDGNNIAHFTDGVDYIGCIDEITEDILSSDTGAVFGLLASKEKEIVIDNKNNIGSVAINKDVNIKYADGEITAKNLKPENIAKDVKILGVTGTYEGGGGNTLKALLDYTKSAYHMFYYNSTITDLTDYINYSDTENVENMNGIFERCTKLTTIPPLDTSKATDMSNMFSWCENLESVPPLNTSACTNTSYMFSNCNKLTTIPQLDTSISTNMSYMFNGCSKLETIPQLDTSNVTRMEFMFCGCNELTTISQLDTSKVTHMNNMFQNCFRLTTIPQLDTSSVTNMSQMFLNCGRLTSVPQLDTSKVTNMDRMFYSCSELIKVDISHFNISSTSNTNNWFTSCRLLKAVIIRSFGTKYVLNSNAFTWCYHMLGTKDSTYNPTGAKDGYIYIPRNMMGTLATTTNWAIHFSQFRVLEDYTKDGTTTGEFDDEKAGL